MRKNLVQCRFRWYQSIVCNIAKICFSNFLIPSFFFISYGVNFLKIIMSFNAIDLRSLSFMF